MLRDVGDFIRENKKKCIIILIFFLISVMIFIKFHQDDKNAAEEQVSGPPEVFPMMDEDSEIEFKTEDEKRQEYLDEQQEAEGAIQSVIY